ncbi:uncharacterized protein LOC107269475 isoform X2 [Cephus cinctus]|nr:uncharacterized protein LOC107269475 isoform X2 [Cephus cinctus]XP_024942540.1 uncharacterized protein LOC107269475 isoform X2 [Cephus cinctus]
MTNWITAFQSVAFKDNISNQTIEEDNDLYCTSGHSVFSVKVVETIASKRCGLENKSYTLIVASADMKLMDGEVLLYTWPYRYIRKYGYRGGKFTFEAGRKCESGEGSFRLEHSNQQEIFRCIYTKMKSMKNTMTFLSCDKSPNIDCNDLQYHAAMSMEAGSRSPLPPSPNSSANLIDIDFSTISQNSQKHLNCSSSSLDSVSFIKPPPPIIKPKPTKPPRKHMITALLEKKSGESEFADLSACGKCRRLNSSTSPEQSTKSTWDTTSVEEDKHRYDLVEVRNAAWKTHGIDRVPHMERPKPLSSSNVINDDEGDDESQYETMPHFTITSQASTKNKETLLEGITPISPIIHNNVSSSSDPPNYDKLQYFGSTHKLNHNPGYKTPNIQGSSQASQSNSNTTVSIPVLESHPSWNDYDFIDNMSSIRLADDSHLGYGIIRKKTMPSAPSTSSTSADNAVKPIHKVYNETEYAIVSKPKKV